MYVTLAFYLCDGGRVMGAGCPERGTCQDDMPYERFYALGFIQELPGRNFCCSSELLLQQ